MNDPDVFQWLQAGGDLGVFGIAYLLWRLERRILMLEIELTHVKGKVNGARAHGHRPDQKGLPTVEGR